MTLELFLALSLILLAAGAVKGAVGMGLPTVAIGFMTVLIDPRAAIAFFIAPMVVTNAWQVYRQGHVVRSMRKYARFSLTLMVFVAITVVWSKGASDQILFAVLGAVILMFVALQKLNSPPVLPDRFDALGQVSMGAFAGLLGGLVGIWAPPMVCYLAARRTEKEEFVRASGLIILMGSIPLAIGYSWAGFLTGITVFWSLLLVLPTLLGFAIGERLRNKLSEAGFRSLLLWVFFFMGLNLLRKAISG